MDLKDVTKLIVWRVESTGTEKRWIVASGDRKSFASARDRSEPGRRVMTVQHVPALKWIEAREQTSFRVCFVPAMPALKGTPSGVPLAGLTRPALAAEEIIPQSLKATSFAAFTGTAEAVPLQC